MSVFEEEHPSLESYWRSVVLFGNNVASYKFALAKTLVGLWEDRTASSASKSWLCPMP
jgi:hypothetical protein